MKNAELERLALLSEECGEVVQIIGKILRHGYESCHPSGGPTNRNLLEKEVGDVFFAVRLMCNNNDLSPIAINFASDQKQKTVREYLYFNDPFVCPEEK